VHRGRSLLISLQMIRVTALGDRWVAAPVITGSPLEPPETRTPTLVDARQHV